MTNPQVVNFRTMKRKNPFIAYPQKNPKMSKFELSHSWNHDFAVGKVIPILTMPTMPNDEFTISSEFLFKFLPNYFPYFGMLDLEVNYYYISNRILWRTTTFNGALGSGDGWEAFITYSEEIEHPFVSPNMELLADGEANDLVLGYMNLPYIREAVGFDDQMQGINCLPLSAYLICVDTMIRNDKIEPGRWFNLDAGDNQANFVQAFAGYLGDDPVAKPGRFRVLSSKWEWDYFTSCTPTPQIGEAVKIPFIHDFEPSGNPSPEEPIFRKVSTHLPSGSGAMSTDAAGEPQVAGNGQVYYDPQGYMADMRQLREAEAEQSFKERLLKVGQRYVDYLKGFFGKAPDPGAIGLPLWFGRYTGKVEKSETYVQAETEIAEATFKVGQYAGNQNLYKRGGTLNITCKEHGWILGLMEMKPQASYGQGVARWWRWALPTDYPLDMFSHIGDQEVLKEEVLYNNKAGKSALNGGTFGYIERDAHMKTMVNRYGTNLTGYTGKQEWAKSIHDGRYWSEGILDDDTRYNEQVEINPWFIDIIKHPPGTGWPSYSGENGQYRVSDLYKTLTLPYNLGETQNPILGLIYHEIWVNRALPYHSTPKLGV